MAYAENRIDGRKDRRSESKTETGKSSAGKADGTLNFALTAGAVGLGIALLEREQATAANAASTVTFSQDDERLSDVSAAIAQAKGGIGQSAIDDQAVHDGGNGVPRAVSEAQIDPRTASSAESKSLAERPQQVEVAQQMAARDDSDAVDSVHDAIVPVVAPVSDAAKSVSTAGKGGAIEETHDRSSLAGQPGVDIMPGDTPAERTVEAVRDIASDLLGSDGLIGVVPAITQVVGSLVGEDGALDGLTDIDGNILDGLIGEDGVLGGLTNGDADVINGLIGKIGVLGAVAGDNGDVLDDLVGAGSVVGAVTGGNADLLDDLVGREGALGTLTDGDAGVLDGLLGENGLLDGLDSAEGEATSAGAALEVAAEPAAAPETTAVVDVAAEPAAPPETTAAMEVAVETAAPPETDTSETPSNLFDVANAALQITEYVADALTPMLKFVGQPILETDAHADTDNSSLTSAQHAV